MPCYPSGIGNSDKIEVLYLAPVSVALEYRDKGVGSDLIKASFELAKKMEYKSMHLVGDPTFYHRFGFKAAIDFGVKHEPDIPNEYVMACELAPNALLEITGVVDFG